MGGAVRVGYWNALVMPNRDGRFKRFIKRAYPKIFMYFNDCIKRNECPVCHKRFKTKYALYRHLHYSSNCRKILYTLVELIRKHVPEKELLEKMGSLIDIEAVV